MDTITITKTISIANANKWLEAISEKAIDIGEVISRVNGYADENGEFHVNASTLYYVSPNLSFTVTKDFIVVSYYGKTLTHWHYHFTA